MRSTALLPLVVGLTLLFHCRSAAQAKPLVAVSSAEQIPWDRAGFSNKRFILTGEAHQVSCNYPFQYSQIEYLVTKGFRNLVWEMPYSYTLIGQRYLDTGNDSLLSYLSWSQDDSLYWKKLFRLNETMAAENKLRLWGIDIELAENIGGSSYRTRLFQKAVALLREGKGVPPPSLQQEFAALDTATMASTALASKQRLKKLLKTTELSLYFGAQLRDFVILVNRMDRYEPFRNDEMLDAFNEICRLYDIDTTEKFLGRFGWGHTNKSFKKSLSWLLENHPSSPVKNSVFVIGVQYLNCTAATAAGGSLLKNEGIVNNPSQKKELAAIRTQSTGDIHMFIWPPEEKRKGWADAADVLFTFSDFPAVRLRLARAK